MPLHGFVHHLFSFYKYSTNVSFNIFLCLFSVSCYFLPWPLWFLSLYICTISACNFLSLFPESTSSLWRSLLKTIRFSLFFHAISACELGVLCLRTGGSYGVSPHRSWFFFILFHVQLILLFPLFLLLRLWGFIVCFFSTNFLPWFSVSLHFTAVSIKYSSEWFQRSCIYSISSCIWPNNLWSSLCFCLSSFLASPDYYR